MDSDEELVRAATLRFYAALEDVVCGRGIATMKEAWHHTPRVTSAHPMGEWSHGWEEVLATWEVIAGLGKPDAGGATLRDLKVHVYGDVAYTTCVFVAGESFGGIKMNVTNVLHRDGGVWKIIHHHADKAPAVEEGFEKLAAAEAAS
jgi:ketosteroid isomerase-like protein